jgi:hypothetical protein
MKIKDEFTVKDSGFVKGVVTLKHKNGKVIFTKENMILQTGRDFFRELVILGAIPDIIKTAKSFTKQYENMVISHMGFGRSGSATSLSMLDLVAPDENFIFALTENYIELEAEQKALIFKGRIDNINGEYGFSAQELGLYITNETLSTEAARLGTKELISRIVFDPIPVSSGDEYEVEYYIYF